MRTTQLSPILPGIIRLLPLLAVFAIGCATSSPYQAPFAAEPIEIGRGEELAVDRAILVFDASGSIDARNEFPSEKAWVESFVQGMPEGDYQASIRSFGGEQRRGTPLSSFDRGQLASTAHGLEYIGKDTPLDGVLLEVADQVEGATGRTAVVVVTDGVPNDPVYGGPPEPVLEAARTIVEKSNGPVCFHTVLAGDDPDQGRALLESLASVTDCGSFRYSNTLTGPTRLAAFERDVFVTEALPAVAAPRPADADRDGVVDASDACPGTPVGAEVDARGCWVLRNLHFATDSAAIKGGGATAIDSVANVLEKNPKLRVEIGGHTDASGSAAYNQKLSERRAKAVKSALVERGIDASRLDTRGYGEEDPAADNATAEGRAENRRIEFTVER